MKNTYLFNLRIKETLPNVALRVVCTPEKLAIDYSIGAYHPMMELLVNGDFVEVVFRDKKVIENDATQNIPSYQYENKVDPAIGRILNAHKSYFVVGAGNGFMGMGITKAERLKDCFFTLISTKKKFIMFDLTINNDRCILSVKYNPIKKEVEVLQSANAVLAS